MTPSPRDVVCSPLALVWAVFGVFIMRPVARGSVNKSRSVRQFRKNYGLILRRLCMERIK